MWTDDDSMFGLLDFFAAVRGLEKHAPNNMVTQRQAGSTAEHSWRLCLMAMLISRQYPELDALRILQLCIIHDLGETINGDISAPEQTGAKDVQEHEDMEDLLRPLPEDVQDELMSLWEEYEYARTPEARLVKAMDKLETLLQQTQGANPSDFDYAFNLDYGNKYTGMDEFISELRDIVDAETKSCLCARTGKLG